MRGAWLLVVGVLACEAPSPVVPSDAAAEAAPPPSACAICEAARCPHEVEECAADPACAAALTCARACPPRGDGGIDPACEASCAPDTGAGAAAFAAWATCRAGARCEACGPVLPAFRDPRLNARCDGVVVPPAVPPDAAACYDAVTEVELRCRACRFQRCCATRLACDSDPACRGFTRCVGCTGSFDCDDAGALERFAPDFECAAIRCLEACGAPPDGCQRCLAERCGDEGMAYGGTAEGFRHRECRTACRDDAACRAACDATYPAAVAPYQAWILCTVARCGRLCAD